MDKNEIKKILYKTNFPAELLYIRKGKAYYRTVIYDPEKFEPDVINFEIPISDMGDADFLPRMEGKLLIRWLQ